MALNSSIEWTDSTWNPVTGCSKISPGCKHCYAERFARRLQSMGMTSYRNGFQVTLQPRTLDLPLHWRKPRTIFVNSMSDLFHDQVPTEYVQRVFAVMERANWHTFQVLTKRPERLVKLADRLPWPDHIWMGVSVETAEYSYRIDLLRQVPSKIRFVSLEPLLAPMGRLDLSEIHWVIVGGESGPKARPLDRQWVIKIRDQCEKRKVPFFFKQWGGANKQRSGRLLDGQVWEQMPVPMNIPARVHR